MALYECALLIYVNLCKLLSLEYAVMREMMIIVFDTKCNKALTPIKHGWLNQSNAHCVSHQNTYNYSISAIDYTNYIDNIWGQKLTHNSKNWLKYVF